MNFFTSEEQTKSLSLTSFHSLTAVLAVPQEEASTDYLINRDDVRKHLNKFFTTSPTCDYYLRRQIITDPISVLLMTINIDPVYARLEDSQLKVTS